METMGFISIIPAILAIVLSFVTRNTIVALAIACITGTLLSGQGLFGFPTLLKESLGTTSFSWVMLLNTFIGILVAYFQKTGAIQGFSQKVHDRNLSRKGAQLMAWILGIFIYFSDSFSPLFVGSVMRSITDKAKVSREKLAYIADSTSAPVSVLMPMVLNCVKWPKGNTQYLITREMVRTMEPGSVIVDISNDEQGALETFHETTHENPRYVEEGVVHYCVSNIPGAIANSTSVAYAASVLPHFRSILNLGVAEACARDGFLRRSLTAYQGYLTHEETSALQNRPWIRPEDILGISDRALDPAPPATVSRSDNFIKL